MSSSKKSWSRSFPYKVDYNDHFETPEVAFSDILPLLDSINPSRKDHFVYDPYYCDGRAKKLLNRLGFENVAHECRDFYKDIETDQVPDHHTVVTNPPYSDQHKEKCLAFVLEQLRTKNLPFFVLMPNYVAAREYYRKLVESKNGEEEDVIYLIPTKPYDYDHPEGTGHGVSPFASIWYCGLGADHRRQVNSAAANGAIKDSDSNVRLFRSLEELRQHKAIPTQKRPNPKQRRKMKRDGKPQEQAEAISTPRITAKRKQSRHRDESGKRTRRRF